MHLPSFGCLGDARCALEEGRANTFWAPRSPVNRVIASGQVPFLLKHKVFTSIISSTAKHHH